MEKKIFKRVMMLFILIGVMSMVTVFASDITNQTISNTSMENTNHTILQNQVQVETQTQPIEQTTSNQQGLNNHDIGLLAVALSTGLACIGAGIDGYKRQTFETAHSYASSNGKLASTTGNVYGVYDMSGGNWERVEMCIRDSQ